MENPQQSPQNIVKPTDPKITEALPPKPVEQRKVLYSWSAPQHYFKKLNKRSFIFVIAAVVALSILLVLLQQYYFIAALFSLVFLLYAVGTFPPPIVTHVITNKGVEFGGTTYEWVVLTGFYYSLRDAQMLLNIETTVRTTGKLILLLNEKQKAETYDVLKEKLMYKDMRKQARISTYIDGVWVDMLSGGKENESGSKADGSRVK